jgi:RNA-directed DNA polymerase
VLAQICCHNNQLPQGAPTSPLITNMICAKLDSQLQRLAKACKATYTRYGDDITFSTTLKEFPESLAKVVTEEGKEKVILGEPLLGIIVENGFQVNENKIRLQAKGNHQEVTGLTVNQFPNVNRKFVRQVRAMLHAWAKFGLEAAEQEFQEKYATKPRSPSKNAPGFKEILRGKIEFIGIVKGKENEIYSRFIDKFNILSRIN